ncbi:hypothetical protein SE1039_00670 [Staphylococcus equorum]|nr:hypothetical protein SE1039_00670 [Staphylococcus equorum]
MTSKIPHLFIGIPLIESVYKNSHYILIKSVKWDIFIH